MSLKNCLYLTIACAIPLLPALANSDNFDFKYLGNSLTPIQTLEQQLKSKGDGQVTWKDDTIRLAASKTGDFSVTLPVEPEAEYLLRAKVKSTDQVVFRVGELSMSYNDLGQWQTVAGLCRVGKLPTTEIELKLKSLTEGQPASAEIRDVSFIRVERPTTTSRHPFSGETDLVKNGAPTVTIIVPAGQAIYLKMAQAIAASVKSKTGVDLPIVSDVEATEKDYPILKAPFHSQNLILLGRLGNNRAIWTAYNHFLTAVDGFYPGKDGYAVHTAANVFHDGINHLIIGGTSDEGVQRGTEKFIAEVDAVTGSKSTLRLPWLLDIDLQGDCLKFFQKDDAKWEEKPDNALLPKPEPGYGNVIRWYDNAMGYYWTGWKSYQKREEKYLAQILTERAVTHQYVMEFFVRAYNMLDGSGIIPSNQVAQVDSLLVQNFFDYLTFSELTWMTTFAPPYGNISLINRHQVAPWMSDYKMAEFITDVLTPEGGMKDLAQFRRQEKERAFIDFVKHRSSVSLPGGSYAEMYEEITASFFRFALEKDLYREFFKSGNAQRGLVLERINPQTGLLAYPGGERDSKLLFGIMASLTHDPEYQWLWNHLPEKVGVRGYFQQRYLGQTRRYTPDANSPESVPVSWSGIHFAANPVDNDNIRRSDQQRYSFVSEGSGLEALDDRVDFNGGSEIGTSGILVLLASNGVTWLNGGLGDGGRFNLNSVSVIRTDRLGKQDKFSSLSRCLWSAELPTGNALSFRQLLSPEIEWTRDYVHLGKGVFVFRDHFTALAEGTYSLAVSWHPSGVFSREGSHCSFLTRDGRMQLDMFGSDFAMITSPRGDDDDRASVRQQALIKLAKGQSVVSWTVIQTTPNTTSSMAKASLLGEDRLSVGSAVLDWKPTSTGPLATNADLVIQMPTETGFYNASKVALNDRDTADFHERTSVSVSAAGKWNKLPAEQNLTEEMGRNVFRAAKTLIESGATAGATAIAKKEGDLQLATQDARSHWRQVWQYDGMLRPARISFPKMDAGIIDLGEVLNITEFRVKGDGPIWHQTRLPETLELATEREGPWKPAEGTRLWRPGVRTGNYGESHPEKESDETLQLPSVPARYVKTTPGANLVIFTDSQKEPRHPIRVETGDFLANGTRQTFVVSDVYPQFPRSLREDDLSAALLDHQGKLLFQLDFNGPIQSIRLLDRHGKGARELFVLYASGMLEIYDLTGKKQASADLNQLHEDFQKKFGRSNTRQPAGGFVMPFSIGLWRPDAAGNREIIIGRYGNFTFLNPDLTFKGVLFASGYSTPGQLEEGFDFAGNGIPEQVVAERLRIWQLAGKGEPTVRNPNGAQFWPQVYELAKIIPEDISSRVPLGGNPIVCFQALKELTPKPRYVLLARGNTLSLYDAKEKKMQFSWSSQASITALGIVSEHDAKLKLLLATGDGLLWNFDWANGMDHDPTAIARLFPDLINNIQEAGAQPRSLVLAGNAGLYLATPGGEFEQIAGGEFQSAAPLTLQGGQIEQVSAVDQGGVVHCFEKQN